MEPLIQGAMKTIKNLERLQHIHALIQSESTGSPLELGRRMHISERSVYHLIEQLRDFNAVICYDRGRKTYYYKASFKLQIRISVSIKNNNEVSKVFDQSYFNTNKII